MAGCEFQRLAFNHTHPANSAPSPGPPENAPRPASNSFSSARAGQRMIDKTLRSERLAAQD
jgi:hypothetical protein